MFVEACLSRVWSVLPGCRRKRSRMGPDRFDELAVAHSSTSNECEVIVELAQFPVANEVELRNGDQPQKDGIEVDVAIIGCEAIEEIDDPSTRDVVSDEDMFDPSDDGMGEGAHKSEVNIYEPENVLVNKTGG